MLHPPAFRISPWLSRLPGRHVLLLPRLCERPPTRLQQRTASTPFEVHAFFMFCLWRDDDPDLEIIAFFIYFVCFDEQHYRPPGGGRGAGFRGVRDEWVSAAAVEY